MVKWIKNQDNPIFLLLPCTCTIDVNSSFQSFFEKCIFLVTRKLGKGQNDNMCTSWVSESDTFTLNSLGINEMSELKVGLYLITEFTKVMNGEKGHVVPYQ